MEKLLLHSETLEHLMEMMSPRYGNILAKETPISDEKSWFGKGRKADNRGIEVDLEAFDVLEVVQDQE